MYAGKMIGGMYTTFPILQTRAILNNNSRKKSVQHKS